MNFNISFKDILGNELKVGDTVFAVIEGKLRERVITRIELILRGLSSPYFGVKLEGQGVGYWGKKNPTQWRYSKTIGAEDGVTLVKKPEAHVQA